MSFCHINFICTLLIFHTTMFKYIVLLILVVVGLQLLSMTADSYHIPNATVIYQTYSDDANASVNVSTPSNEFSVETTNYSTFSSTPRALKHTTSSTHVKNKTTTSNHTKEFRGKSMRLGYSNGNRSSFYILLAPFVNVYISRAKDVFLESMPKLSECSVEFICGLTLIQYVSVNVTNMTLFIDSTGDCDIVIRTDEFRTIQIENIISLRTADMLKGKQLTIEANSATYINLHNISYDLVRVLLLKDSNVTLSGYTQQLHVIQQGQGIFDSRLLSVDQATVFIEESGLVLIKTNKHLSLTVSHKGNVIWCSPYINIYNTKRTTNLVSPHIVYHCD